MRLAAITIVLSACGSAPGQDVGQLTTDETTTGTEFHHEGTEPPEIPPEKTADETGTDRTECVAFTDLDAYRAGECAAFRFETFFFDAECEDQVYRLTHPAGGGFLTSVDQVAQCFEVAFQNYYRYCREFGDFEIRGDRLDRIYRAPDLRSPTCIESTAELPDSVFVSIR